MIRLLITLFFIVLFAAGGMYLAYGTVDPCTALAVERGDRAEARTGLPVSGIVRHLTETPPTSLACADGLMTSWRERLAELMAR